MFSALSGMGGGGQIDHEAANNANTALYTMFAVFSILGGGIYNLLGPRLTLLAGCSTYVFYAGSFLLDSRFLPPPATADIINGGGGDGGVLSSAKIPTPTDASNNTKKLVAGLPQETIFDSLHEAGYSFGIYYQYPSSTLFYRNLRQLKYIGNFHQFDLDFKRHCKEGKLPNYVVIEQRYFNLKI